MHVDVRDKKRRSLSVASPTCHHRRRSRLFTCPERPVIVTLAASRNVDPVFWIILVSDWLERQK